MVTMAQFKIEFILKLRTRNSIVELQTTMTSLCHTIETFISSEITNLWNTTMPPLEENLQVSEWYIASPYVSLAPGWSFVANGSWRVVCVEIDQMEPCYNTIVK